jgi:hypothetical protein
MGTPFAHELPGFRDEPARIRHVSTDIVDGEGGGKAPTRVGV